MLQKIRFQAILLKEISRKMTVSLLAIYPGIDKEVSQSNYSICNSILDSTNFIYSFS